MLNNVKNISFQGYKNIISNDLTGNNSRTIFFSAQLNNENCSDLNNYQKIINSDNRFQSSVSDDIITCLYIRNGMSDRITLNGIPLPWGTELIEMQHTLPKDLYKKEEGIALKCYTLLANITRQMMQNNLCTKDSKIIDVFKKLMNFWNKVGLDKKSAYDLVKSSLISNEPFDKSALYLNRRIQKSMNTLLK